MKIFSFVISLSYFCFAPIETFGASEQWIKLPNIAYEASSRSLTVEVSPTTLRLIDSGTSFNISMEDLLSEHPAMYLKLRQEVSTASPSKILSHPIFNNYILLIGETPTKYTISIRKKYGFPFPTYLGNIRK